MGFNPGTNNFGFLTNYGHKEYKTIDDHRFRRGNILMRFLEQPEAANIIPNDNKNNDFINKEANSDVIRPAMEESKEAPKDSDIELDELKFFLERGHDFNGVSIGL